VKQPTRLHRENMSPAVAVITLNWNGWRDTVECLKSLYQTDYASRHIVVVDNASTDESLAKIDWYCTNELKFVHHFTETTVRNKPIKVTHYTKGRLSNSVHGRELDAEPKADYELTVIQNRKNHGFAEGNNMAIAYALKTLNPDYVLLVNNDTIVCKNFLNELVTAAEQNEQIGLLQPKILRYVDSTIESTGIMCDTLAYSKFRGFYEKDEGQYDNDREDGFFYASGACVLIRKSLLTALSDECFDPYLFAYYEDVDLSWMARLIGFKVVYCPESVCYHKGRASFGDETPLAIYLGLRNRLRVLIKNYSVSTLIFVLPLTIVLKFSLLTFNCIVNLDSSYLSSFVKALGWNVLNLRSALILRERIQSKRKLRDTEIMKYMIPYSFGIRAALKDRSRHRTDTAD